MTYPEIFVLRHGQTEWNLEGRHQGRLDSPLTELGRSQARDQGAILAGLERNWAEIDMFCSPQGRACATAAFVGAAIARQSVEDARLREVSFGVWEGLTLAEIATAWPEHDHESDPYLWHFTAPNGENFEEMRQRCTAFLGELRCPTVIVTHGITSRTLRGIWLGFAVEEFSEIGGGQGVVYHLKDGKQAQLTI